MKKWLTAAGLMLVLCAVLLGAAQAEGDIKVVSSEAQPSFAKNVAFRLDRGEQQSHHRDLPAVSRRARGGDEPGLSGVHPWQQG